MLAVVVTGQFCDEKHDSNWTEDGEILEALEDTRTGDIDSKPERYLSKIVWMS